MNSNKLLPLVVTEDNRLGNNPRLIFHPKDQPLMQIPDQILKCVAFISCRKHDGIHERGTGFFMSQILPDTDRYVDYAVTAKHIVKGIERDGIDGMTHLRVNSRVRGAVYIELPVSAWHFHPNRVDVDVA